MSGGLPHEHEKHKSVYTGGEDPAFCYQFMYLKEVEEVL